MTEQEAVDAAVESMAAKQDPDWSEVVCAKEAARHAFRAAVRECVEIVKEDQCGWEDQHEEGIRFRFPEAFKEDADGL